VPRIDIVDQGIQLLFQENDKTKLKIDITKVLKFLGMKKLTHPQETIERIIRSRLSSSR
jgi:hypothetical protein